MELCQSNKKNLFIFTRSYFIKALQLVTYVAKSGVPYIGCRRRGSRTMAERDDHSVQQLPLTHVTGPETKTPDPDVRYPLALANFNQVFSPRRSALAPQSI
ncbi:hypothetical protein M5D96_006666 [Drosophila gunungcola]|uniref:Uncharacterized protein n=1 Tax=Drosophila gunungcola TaxID=103775 RepID=A0A9P9YPX5_9MUSC|nr:hypothetical protein M5D96_006666 [Drosophila gunungcola]